MQAESPPCNADDANDQIEAIDFVARRIDDWRREGRLTDPQAQAMSSAYARQRQAVAEAGQAGLPVAANVNLPPRNRCWSCKAPIPAGLSHCDACGVPLTTAAVKSLRFFRFLSRELDTLERSGTIRLRQAHELVGETQDRIAALKLKLERDRAPMLAVLPAGDAAPMPVAPAVPAAAALPRRPLLEILLDPRSIQWLLAGGGALLVLGLVIYLVAIDFFQDKRVVAVAMGLGTGALLGGGWAVIRFTRYQMAGRALALLACLVMPLNLWFYEHFDLITVEGHLWIAALVCCALYAASALMLRDELFVYVLAGGVAMTGLLILGDQNIDKFWEVARPASMLVVLGLVFLGGERAFPVQEEGPFTRTRFGMAFFWSGQALLGAGLLFLLGGELFALMHEFLVRLLGLHGFLAEAPDILKNNEIGLALVLAGLAAYLYSDIVVRRVGFYVYLAIFNLLWAEVLIIGLFDLEIGMELVIASLALTALAGNLLQVVLTKKVDALSRSGPPLGLFLSSVPVILGLILHMRATNADIGRYGISPYTPTWGYVTAMPATALSCRIGAYIFRHTMPRLSGIYFLGTAAATLIGAAGLLVVLDIKDWTWQVPMLMLIPIAYLVAARLYKGHTAEQPLIYVGHTATAVMALTVLVCVLHITSQVFAPITKDFVNLRVALFFAEAALFYGLATAIRPKGYNVYLGAAMACAAVWQLLTYWDTPPDYYTLAFSVLGFALLLAYRLALLERFNQNGLATAGFQSANVLLSLAFAATVLLSLRDLAIDHPRPLLRMLVFLLILQTVLSLLSAWLVQHQGWRRWYVIAAIVMAGLTFAVLYQLSELNVWQKLEIFSVVLGILLLVVGHLGWYREVERQQDMVSTGLLLGSLLAAVPLIVAVGMYRTSAVTQIDAPNIVRTTNNAIDPVKRKLTVTMTVGDKKEEKNLDVPAEARIFIKGKQADLNALDNLPKDTLVLVGLSDANPENAQVLAISVIRRLHFPDELGLFVVGLALLASGIVLQIKSTTIVGGLAMGLNLVGMLLFIRIPEARQTLGLFLAIGGGSIFGIGLLLSIYRDRLLALPEKIIRREGLFKVLSWR